jgi:hypothetical protein
MTSMWFEYPSRRLYECLAFHDSPGSDVTNRAAASACVGSRLSRSRDTSQRNSVHIASRHTRRVSPNPCWHIVTVTGLAACRDEIGNPDPTKKHLRYL